MTGAGGRAESLLPMPHAAPAGPPPDEYMHFIHRRGEAVRAGVPARIMAKKGWGCQGNFRIVVGSGFLSIYFVYFTAQGLIIVVACGIFSCGVWGLVP